MLAHVARYLNSTFRLQGTHGTKVVYAPIDARTAFARDSLKRCTSESCSASTMTRASGSVPEYRRTMRPLCPSAEFASDRARDTSGSESNGGFERTFTFTIICG